MKTECKLKDLEEIKAVEVVPLSRRGSGGPVYMISDDRVAKFAWCRRGLESMFFSVTRNPKKVQHEYEICKYLYENGVSVPKPIGVFKLKGLSPEWSDFPFHFRYPAFVMQYVPGFAPNPRYASEETMRAFDEGLRIELEKISRLDVNPSDICVDNTLFSRSDKKLYLIDFNQWTFPGETYESLL